MSSSSENEFANTSDYDHLSGDEDFPVSDGENEASKKTTNWAIAMKGVLSQKTEHKGNLTQESRK